MCMIVSESDVIVMARDHTACRRIQIGTDPRLPEAISR
jgi:hypothetical protein